MSASSWRHWAVGKWAKRQAAVPIASVVLDGGNRVGNKQNHDGDGDNHNHNHIKEVTDSNNEHPEFPVITGRFQQSVNQR